MAGALMMVQGTLHDLVTPFVAARFEGLPPLEYRVFVLVFLATGTAVIVAGALQWRFASPGRTSTGSERFVFVVTGGFVSAVGAGAVTITPWNPFAYLLFLTGVLGIFSAWPSLVRRR